MLQTIRKEKIINLLQEKKECEISELCKYFNVSLATIHRDLNELEREGRVNKVHGGVILNVVEKVETKNTIRLKTNIQLKKEIAAKALEFVENNDCLFLDNSTTCYYFAEALACSEFKDLVIVTNSYPVPGLFLENKHIKVVSTGGLLENEYNCFVGQCAIETISKFNSNKFFLSTGMISVKGELSDNYSDSLNEIKREMYKRSKEHICLVDSTKFNRIGQSRVFKISEMDKIITDNNCSKETRAEFAKNGKELIIA
ncbi:MAG: DeoR/GlpR family DNA-binding transcription regulator [Candidatus Humimicrobiaceae bacterium]|jgi:DeoR/GlpR family transcriptional regulator of sugar metabolism|nr:DeoR/GlpR family DNA-binding transcription regulator [Candidatus Humimicrobiaceae bacterium]